MSLHIHLSSHLARPNIREAIQLYIETLKDLGKPIPASDPKILVEAVEVNE